MVGEVEDIIRMYRAPDGWGRQPARVVVRKVEDPVQVVAEGGSRAGR